jgi:retinol dehydrogenase 12
MFGLFGPPAFDPKQIPDLSGKVIIVTGASGTGLGYQTILHLAPHHPSKIYLCARSQSKYDTAMRGITAAVPNAADFIKYLQLDLSSLSSVHSAAQTFLAENTRLDILINNAGIMAQPPGLTHDGYELQFGTNHLGHFLLTKLLLPLLLSTASTSTSTTSPSPRIINLTSAGHRLAPRTAGFLPTACTTPMQEYSTWTRYGQSKLCNILFTRELTRRFPHPSSRLAAVSVHPGVVGTNLTGSFAEQHPWLARLFEPLIPLWTASPSVGAWNQTWAAVAPVEEEGDGEGGQGSTMRRLRPGAYYVPVAKEGALGRWAADEALAVQLWEWSEGELAKLGY